MQQFRQTQIDVTPQIDVTRNTTKCTTSATTRVWLPPTRLSLACKDIVTRSIGKFLLPSFSPPYVQQLIINIDARQSSFCPDVPRRNSSSSDWSSSDWSSSSSESSSSTAPSSSSSSSESSSSATPTSSSESSSSYESSSSTTPSSSASSSESSSSESSSSYSDSSSFSPTRWPSSSSESSSSESSSDSSSFSPTQWPSSSSESSSDQLVLLSHPLGLVLL